MEPPPTFYLGHSRVPSTSCRELKSLGLFPHQALEFQSPGSPSPALCPRRMFTDLRILSMTTSRALGQDPQPSVRLASPPFIGHPSDSGTNLAQEHDSRSLQIRHTEHTSIRVMNLSCALPPPRARQDAAAAERGSPASCPEVEAAGAAEAQAGQLLPGVSLLRPGATSVKAASHAISPCA